MKQHRRILSLAMALVLCLGIMAAPAHAATVTTKEFDDDGNVIRKWAIDTETGTAVPVESPAPEEATTPTEPPVEPSEPTPPAEATEPTGPIVFTDVPADAWYAEAVNALAEGGLVQGTGDGKFNPDGEVTYGELATVLCRLYALGEWKPLSGETYLGNNSAYGWRAVHVRYLDENEYTGTHAPAHWAAAANYYMNTAVLPLAETEDLDVPAIRGTALVHVAYAALYAKAGAPAYVNSYTPDDIPDWNDVLGITHEVHGDVKAYECVYESNMSYRTLHVWPIDDELHFLPNEYVFHNYFASDSERGYNMQSVADNDLGGKTWVKAYPDLVLKAYNMGLTNGVDENGACDVYGHLTRAELCAMLYRAGLTTKQACNFPENVGSYACWYDGKKAGEHNAKYYQ